MTNMVDAILMKEADRKGIDPKGDGENVLKNIYQAVDQLIKNLHGGKLFDADRNWLKNYSCKNLAIGIIGSKGSKESDAQPCFTFADNGEGQNSDAFEETFLSLSSSHKKTIPFVQGKFNMGSSGVLLFCGKHWFKLIISRRYTKNNGWGCTLIRKRPGKHDLPIAEYFKINNQIPSFNINNRRLFPFDKADGTLFEDFKLESGTIIKLYNFFLGKGFNTKLNKHVVTGLTVSMTAHFMAWNIF